MSRRQNDPLRRLQDTERVSLVRLSRSASAPAAQVARARGLLAVAEGLSYTADEHLVGRRTATPWRAGLSVSTTPGWPRSCRAMAAAIRFARARSSNAVSSPRLLGRRTARVMARRVGR